MNDLTISVSQAGLAAARTFALEVGFAGKMLAKRTLTPIESQQLIEIGSQYFSLLRGAGQPGKKSYLSILSNSLSILLIGPGAKDPGYGVLTAERLIVSSSIPEVLQLPWELLSLYGNDKEKHDIPVIRKTEGEAYDSLPEPSAGPLRLLFMAADSVDYEDEERRILRMAEGQNIEIAICESGRPEDLKGLAEQFKPHLIHLAAKSLSAGGGEARGGAGGGVRDAIGRAVLSFAGESDRSDYMSAEDLVSLLRGAAAWGIMVSGRPGDDPSGRHLFCQLLSGKTHYAVAIDGSIDSVLPFYRSLAKGEPLEQALISKQSEEALSFDESAFTSPPVLYSIHSSGFGPMIDPDLRPLPSQFRSCLDLESLPGLAKCRAECFVGRRREIQRLFPPLREGSVQTLIITGPEGSGKSALAVRLSVLMKSSGYSIIPVYSSGCNGITCTRLIEAVADHLGSSGQDEESRRLREPGSIQKRLESLMDIVKNNRLLLLLDGLDLESKSNRIRDENLSKFYLKMIRAIGQGRAIVTCRALPADALTLPSRTWQWKTEGLYEAAFIRGLLFSPEAAARYKRGEIGYGQLSEHHRVSSGFPDRMAQTSRALALDDIAPGEDVLLRLISRLDEASAKAISKAAIYEIAISFPGIAAVCGMTEEEAQAAASRWHALSLTNSSHGLSAISSSLRRPLLARLSEEEMLSAHKAAAFFLKEIAGAGRSGELEISRLDAFLEARGHFIAAKEWNDAAKVTGRISGYLRRRGYHDEIIRLNREIVLSCASCIAGPSAWIGQAYLDQEEFKKAEEWYSRALETGADSAVHHGLGLSLMNQGKDDLARESLQKAVDGFSASGDHSGEAASLSALAALDMKKGEIEAAVERLDRVAETLRLLGDVPGEAQALQETGRLEMIGKNFEGARARLTRSLELLQSIQDERGAAFALFNLASLDLERGEFGAAGEEYSRALPIFRKMGDRAGQAAILHSQGLIHAQAGEKDIAGASFMQALFINQDLGDKAAEAGSFFQLGVLAVQNDKMAEGLRLMALAAVVLRSINSDEVKNVEPLVERLAAQLNYSQEQFMAMVQEVLQSYARDKGRKLVEKAFNI